jgi:hypothetical protein
MVCSVIVALRTPFQALIERLRRRFPQEAARNTDRTRVSPAEVAIQGAAAAEARPSASSQRIEVLEYDRMKLDDDAPPRVVGFDA